MDTDPLSREVSNKIFSPPVTAALQYVAHHGGEEFAYFKDCSATVKYMENMYSRGQKKVGQVLLRNLAKIELSKPGLL
jgi:hypothetical protein